MKYFVGSNKYVLHYRKKFSDNIENSPNAEEILNYRKEISNEDDYFEVVHAMSLNS